MGNFEKFEEKLPSNFYSLLTGKDVCDKNYKHAVKVQNIFEMKTMKDYHDWHLKYDVLLLADVFEKFRNNSLKNYGLFSSHYLSTPVLSQDAILNMNKFEPECISDSDMYLFFEKGMRGGVSYISKEPSKTNNKYLKSYDPKQRSKHIIYLNASNLNGYAMSKFLPTGRFNQIDPKEFYLNKYNKNSSKGCVLEVDLEYLKELCKLHNDYSLAPDKMEIKEEMLSYCQVLIIDFNNVPIGSVKILVPNCFDK